MSRITQALDRDEMKTLCEKARAANLKAQITGLLLSDGERFIQAIEGPEKTVTDLMEIIRKDTRHTDITLIESARIMRREFGEWGMICRHVEDALAAETFKEEIFSLTDIVSDHGVRAAFVGFVAMIGMRRSYISTPLIHRPLSNKGKHK